MVGQLNFWYFPSGRPRANTDVLDNVVLDYFKAWIKCVKYSNHSCEKPNQLTQMDGVKT